MPFTDEPVRADAVAAWRTAPAVGDVHGYGVTEHIVLRINSRHIFSRPPNHCAKLNFPIGTVAAVWDNDFIVGTDNGAARGLEEHVRDAAVFFTLTHRLATLLLATAFIHMTVKVHCRIEQLAGI